MAGEIQESETSLGIQKRDGGRAVAAADVENAGEFAIAKEILDGVGADVDVVAPAVEIRLRRFEEGLYFVELGTHGTEDDGRDFMEATILILKGEAGAANSCTTRWKLDGQSWAVVVHKQRGGEHRRPCVCRSGKRASAVKLRGMR